MGRYFRRRLLTAIPVFFGITFLVFVLLSLSPADVTDLGEGASGGAQQAALEEALGLDKPLPVRYLAWLGGLLRGAGTVLPERSAGGRHAGPAGGAVPAADRHRSATGHSAGPPLGILAAWRPRSGWDRAASALSLVSFGVPGFFLCLVGCSSSRCSWAGCPPRACMSTACSPAWGTSCATWPSRPGWCASAAWGSWSSRPAPPAWSPWGGLHPHRPGQGPGGAGRHGAPRLPGALTPVLTTVLGHIPHIIGGSVVVEQVFGWPGMGSLLFWGIENRDYPVVMGVTVVIALAVLLTNLLLDLAYGLADPRVRYGRG
ncbi:MAG: ABC transporter permease [Flavonifractor plautii]